MPIKPTGGAHSRIRIPLYIAALSIVAIASVLVLTLSGRPGCWNPTDSTPCTRVLFVGNSYTLVNDLPDVFARLANSGGHRVDAGTAATNGWSLADQAASPATAAALTSAKWNFVVLQEQSEVPSVEQLREQQMYPAARKLVFMVRNAGAQPLFFLTWAHRDGWPQNGLVDYTAMQAAIDDGYLAIAMEQHAAIAPVGVVWEALVGKEVSPGLWQDDGSHPTTKGTYLAACVFYAAIFRESPKGLSYRGDLSDSEAFTLQQLAADTVLGDPARWGPY